MIPMPQVPTAVGRPPVATGVSVPNRAATPRLAAPSVATAPVGRPPAPGGQQARPRSMAAAVQRATGPRGAIAAGPQKGIGVGAAVANSFASKFAGQPKPQMGAPDQIAQGAVGGWNAAPEIVASATKMLKAGAELGPQHRGPLESLLRNTDRPQPGPYASAAAEAFRGAGRLGVA